MEAALRKKAEAGDVSAARELREWTRQQQPGVQNLNEDIPLPLHRGAARDPGPVDRSTAGGSTGRQEGSPGALVLALVELTMVLVVLAPALGQRGLTKPGRLPGGRRSSPLLEPDRESRDQSVISRRCPAQAAASNLRRP